MKVRYDIIKKYCVDVDNDVVVNDDDNFLPLLLLINIIYFFIC